MRGAAWINRRHCALLEQRGQRGLNVLSRQLAVWVLSLLAGNAQRLYYNVDAACGTGNDYRAYDACGCSSVSPPPPPPPHDCSACGGYCDGGIGIFSSTYNACTNPSESHYCTNPADGANRVSFCQPALPSPPPPPVSRGPSCTNQLLNQPWTTTTEGVSQDCNTACANIGRTCEDGALIPTSEQCMESQHLPRRHVRQLA